MTDALFAAIDTVNEPVLLFGIVGLTAVLCKQLADTRP